MRAFGYRQSNSDHTLFLKKKHGKITALIVYVDDMVVTGNDPKERKTLQNYLSREFEMKDLGPLKYFLGIEVSRSSEGIFLSQRKYALDLLQEIGMSGCQPINTSIEEGLKLCVEPNQVSTDKGRYQRLVGRLMYLAYTRPDLAYALSVVSQYMHNPREQHMNAVMRILRYLKNAPGKGILFAKNIDHQSIEVYTDADWVGAVDDRRSTSGYFTFVGGNLVTWKSKKQNVVARSSAEAEFRGMALGLCEALWLRLLLQDLGYLSRQPIRLFCDNKAACDIAHDPVQLDRTKHVEMDRFFIKEKLDDKIVELPKIRSEDQLANVLTKAVSKRVEYNSPNGRSFRELLERLENIIIIETQKLEHVGQATKSWRCGEWEIREAVEGDGRGGLGDSIDVRGGGRRVKRASCEENDNGEFAVIEAKNELTKLYHGHQVANAGSGSSLWQWANGNNVPSTPLKIHSRLHLHLRKQPTGKCKEILAATSQPHNLMIGTTVAVGAGLFSIFSDNHVTRYH
ncbi:Retrovirus-related Pol polyprotein from transposon RE1 [Vitis vinifera]|uniref:Retrovirus-related Pol polyprotein from transposon RE1 n=1 Tax=Vitis vinifera TaxID=29760 RepID=A0A438BMQ1_VITVI|nr:Retrovirus-related Pol polyprotein from transposon RE1 [Vitis vinifera]